MSDKRLRRFLFLTTLISAACDSCSVKKGEIKVEPNPVAPAPATGEQSSVLKPNQFLEIETAPFSSSNLKSLFIQSPSATVSSFAAFFTNGTFVYGMMRKSGSSIYYGMGVIGYYTQNAGNIFPNPVKSSCPTFRDAGKLLGSDLDSFVTSQIGATSTVLVKSQPILTPSAIVVQWGCLNANTGSFTAQDWIPLNT